MTDVSAGRVVQLRTALAFEPSVSVLLTSKIGADTFEWTETLQAAPASGGGSIVEWTARPNELADERRAANVSVRITGVAAGKRKTANVPGALRVLRRGVVTGALSYRRTWDHDSEAALTPPVDEAVPGLQVELWGATTAGAALARVAPPAGKSVVLDQGGAFRFDDVPPLAQARLRLLFEHAEAAVFIGNRATYAARPVDWRDFTSDFRAPVEATYQTDVLNDASLELTEGKTVAADLDLDASKLDGAPTVALGDVRIGPMRTRRLCDAWSTFLLCWRRTQALTDPSFKPPRCVVRFPARGAQVSGTLVLMSDPSLSQRCVLTHEYGHFLAGHACERVLGGGYDYRCEAFPDSFKLTGVGHTSLGRTHMNKAFQEGYATFIGCAIREKPTHHQFWPGATTTTTKASEDVMGNPIPANTRLEPPAIVLDFDARLADFPLGDAPDAPRVKLGAQNERGVLHALWRAFAPADGGAVTRAGFQRFWTVFRNKGKPKGQAYPLDDVGDLLVRLRATDPESAKLLAAGLEEAGSPFVWRFGPRGDWTATAAGLDRAKKTFSTVDSLVAGPGVSVATYREEFWNCNQREPLNKLGAGSGPLGQDPADPTKVSSHKDPRVIPGKRYTVPFPFSVHELDLTRAEQA